MRKCYIITLVNIPEYVDILSFLLHFNKFVTRKQFSNNKSSWAVFKQRRHFASKLSNVSDMLEHMLDCLAYDVK
jgi:hypothetical protein